jgi:hypothetical protein
MNSASGGAAVCRLGLPIIDRRQTRFLNKYCCYLGQAGLRSIGWQIFWSKYNLINPQAGYEPSADELIDVLKNLENLAAANPGLYRTIVQQIKGDLDCMDNFLT